MAGQGKGPLRVAFEDFLETFDFPKIGFEWIKTIIEKFEDEAIDTYREFANNLGVLEYIPDMLKPDAMRKNYTKHPIQIIPILISLVMMVIGLLIGVFAPLQRIGMYKVDKIVRSNRPTAIEAWMMAYRVNPDSPDVTNMLQELGYDDAVIEGYKALSNQLLTPLDYVVAFRRGDFTAGELVDKLKRMGYDIDTINTLLHVTEVIPNIGDLIRMAVREAFSPDVVARFSYDEAFPEAILEFTRKQGLSDEWVKRSWYAHWELPSPTQAYEMLHRLRPGRTDTVFTEDDLDLLLRTADYAPYFRDRLKLISYNPITRVDVRRMYKLKVFDENEVKERYMDIGYTQKDAELLAEFTVKYESADGGDTRDKYKDLSFTVLRNLWEKGKITESDLRAKLANANYAENEIQLIIEYFNLSKLDNNTVDYRAQFIREMVDYTAQAYTARMITRGDAVSSLTAVGITEENIDFILKKADYGSSLDLLNYQLKQIHGSYVAGALTRDQMIAELGNLGITGSTQSKVIDEMEVDIKYRNRRLTEAEYRKAMLQSIISVDDYKRNLQALGYIDYDIDILLALYVPSE